MSFKVGDGAVTGPASVKSSARTSRTRRVRIVAGVCALVLVLLVAALAGPTMKFVHHRRSQEWKDECDAAVHASDWERLGTLSDRWLEWDPQSNDGLMFSAEASAQLGDVERCAETLGKVSDSYRGALQALAFRAEILFADLNRPFEAEQAWKRMLSINKRADVPRQRLIYFYALTLQRRKMVDQIEQAIRLGCEPPEAYTYLVMQNTLNFSDGMVILSRWRDAYPDSEILEVAQAIYVARHTKGKLMATFGTSVITPGDQTLLNRCLEKYPSNLEVLALKIDQAVFEGDTSKVASLLRRAPPEAEEDGRFWRFRGWLLSTQSRFGPAEESLHRALELDPFDWRSRWQLADLLRKLERNDEADVQSQLALQGKEFEQEIFERPNARDLTPELTNELHDYVKKAGPEWIVAALQRRM